jgi:hypothetical protein
MPHVIAERLLPAKGNEHDQQDQSEELTHRARIREALGEVKACLGTGGRGFAGTAESAAC